MTNPQKEIACDYWASCDRGEVHDHLASALIWDGPQPVPAVRSRLEFFETWLEPLNKALPDFQRQLHILMSGTSSGKVSGEPDDRQWVAGMGYLNGAAKDAFFGIPAGGKPLRLRWAEFLRFQGNEIDEVQMQIDIVDWLEQIGCPILPGSRGVPGVWPAPTAIDGVAFSSHEGETAKTLKLGRDLLFGGLNSFDSQNLSSMGMSRFFHPNVKWYGPGGIGACLSLDEFEEFHQNPWLKSFPDRKVQDLSSLFANGRFLAASGTAAVKATYNGAAYLDGGQPKGEPLVFSGLDFWLRTDDVFTENWVFVDFVHLFSQMGIDLIDRIGQR